MPRDECEHGQLRRSCDRCEDAATIAHLTRERDEALAEVTRRDAAVDRLVAELSESKGERDEARAEVTRLRELVRGLGYADPFTDPVFAERDRLRELLARRDDADHDLRVVHDAVCAENARLRALLHEVHAWIRSFTGWDVQPVRTLFTRLKAATQATPAEALLARISAALEGRDGSPGL